MIIVNSVFGYRVLFNFSHKRNIFHYKQRFIIWNAYTQCKLSYEFYSCFITVFCFVLLETLYYWYFWLQPVFSMVPSWIVFLFYIQSWLFQTFCTYCDSLYVPWSSKYIATKETIVTWFNKVYIFIECCVSFINNLFLFHNNYIVLFFMCFICESFKCCVSLIYYYFLFHINYILVLTYTYTHVNYIHLFIYFRNFSRTLKIWIYSTMMLHVQMTTEKKCSKWFRAWNIWMGE